MEEVKELLKGINREGMDKLIEYMETKGFFTSPASTRYHGNYEGGLAEHSYNVYKLFKQFINSFNLIMPEDSVIICSICHDLCKCGLYINTGHGFNWNPNNGNGHALLSIQRLEKFIKLTDEEKNIIKYHMGMYGTKEFLGLAGEYTLQELTHYFNKDNKAKLFYFCDDMASQFVDKTR